MFKKAQEEYLSIWNVLVWIFVGIVFFIAISFYTSAEAEIRPIEAKILNQRIIDCLVEEDGSLINLNENFNMYETCSINKDFFDESLLLIKIEFSTLEENQESLQTLIYGNEEFEIWCQTQPDNRKFADCYNEKIFIRHSETDETFLMKVKTASNSKGRRNQP